MQPPPRKGNYAKFLKTLHAEQVLKLQAKNQHECDLLEDIRSYTLKRSAIEKSYSEALLKISSAYLNRKIPNIPDIKTDGGAEQWNMWNVWRTVLEENEKLARARLAAIEVFNQNVVEDTKLLRSQKAAAAKKCVEVLVTVQKELQATVQEVDKTKKFYFDEEHCAHDVRDKAKDLEDKLKKKKGSFFQSITSLQKNSAKVSSKRDQLEEKSTGARNDYLLSLAAANAHQRRYFLVDLQTAIQVMENNVYERVAEYLTLISRTELLTCSATQTSFTRIRDQAQQLSRDYNLQCVYLHYPVLKQHITYDFEPCDNDPIDKITAEHSSAVITLSKEAKRWATKIGRENNAIRENNRKLQALTALRDSGQKVDPNDPNGPDLETKIEELRQSIRKSETSKAKAEARIECLKNGGVNVDEFVQDAETLSVQDVPRSSSSLSIRTDASGAGEPPSSDSYYDSDNYEGTPEKKGDDRPDSVASDDDERRRYDSEADAMMEQERQRIEQLTAGWDDPTQVDWGGEDPAESSAASTLQAGARAPAIYKCYVEETFIARTPDVLTIHEAEPLEIIGWSDEAGWLKARNCRGEEGFVPMKYLDLNRSPFTLKDYTVDEERIADSAAGDVARAADDGQWALPSDPGAWPQAEPAGPTEWASEIVSQSGPHSVTSIEQEIVDDGFHYCIALYDYEATAPEELSFVENQVIKLLRKMPHDVDDGWWEGELDGKIGLFPSLVVEVCRPDGQPITPEEDESPPPSAPPVFTPPEIPSFLLSADQVIVTQPTPVGEAADTASVPEAPPEKAPFQMSMTKGQHEQYEQQFDDAIDSPAVIKEETDEEIEEIARSSSKPQVPSFGGGLGVAEIVITAATPMLEEPETSFPPVEEEPMEVDEEGKGEEKEKAAEEEEGEKKAKVDHPPESQESVEDEASTSEAVTTVVPVVQQLDDNDDPTDDCPTDSAPFPISSSTGSEDDQSTGPSTAENSQSQPPPSSSSSLPQTDSNLPDELDPHQLAKLKNLKESNA